MDNHEDDPKFWRDRAEEAHARAKELSDPTLRAAMFAIARGYEAFADRVEQRLRENRRPALRH